MQVVEVSELQKDDVVVLDSCHSDWRLRHKLVRVLIIEEGYLVVEVFDTFRTGVATIDSVGCVFLRPSESFIAAAMIPRL